MSAGGQGERLELGLDPLSILLQGDGAGEGSSSKPLFDEEVTGEQEGEEEEAEEAEGTIAEEPSEEEIEIYLASPPPAADEPAKLPPMPGEPRACHVACHPLCRREAVMWKHVGVSDVSCQGRVRPAAPPRRLLLRQAPLTRLRPAEQAAAAAA